MAAGVLSLVALGACGGSGGTPKPPPVVAGVAAAGLPIVGKVYLVDAEGRPASAAVAADGSYRIDVTGLEAPFLLEVVGTAGGDPAILHSAATAADVAGGHPIHLTPLTELATAYVLGDDPAAVFRDPGRSLAVLADDPLQSASARVVAQFAPLLDTLGVTGDPRTGALTADRTGMDRALEAIRLVLLPRDGTRAARYEVSLVTGWTKATLDPAAPAEGAQVTFGDPEPSMLTAAISALPAIDAQLQGLAARFATGVPAAASLGPYFAPGFNHNGLDVAAYLAQVLRKPEYVGFTLSRAAIERIDGPTQLWVSVRLGLPGKVPWKEVFRMDRTGAGDWQIAGNQAIAAAAASYMARLTSRGPTEAEVKALPGVVLQTWSGKPCYFLPVPALGTTSYVLLGCQGDATFARSFSIGDPYAQRDTRVATYRFLGRANAAIEHFMIFWISAIQVDPRVATVRVTGPGLPASGLIEVRPDPQFPRDSFILKGDTWNWDSFNTARCAHMDTSYMSGCALDWSAVHAGAFYTFDFRDAGGAPLGTEVRRFLGTAPQSEAAWLAQKEANFPRLHLTSTSDLTMKNVLGPPFAYRGTETVSWTAPTDAALSLGYVSMWRGGSLGDTGAPSDAVQVHCDHDLYGVSSTSASCTWQDAWLTTQAFIDLGAYDLWGNQFAHEVNGDNPY